jgi:TetR/AcrR family transcriptional repressor of lmrAB and yxaGH operons
MSTIREHILVTTCDLLENQGASATGLSEIIRQSGAPKGSLYYYFPAGKEEIVSAAVLYAGRQVAERIRAQLAGELAPGPAVQAFIETIAQHVEASLFRAGGPLTTVAAETATTSPRINQACRQAYSLLKDAFQEKLVQSGRTPEEAERLAWGILAGIEGGTILSRTFHTGEPLRQVARQMGALLGSD